MFYFYGELFFSTVFFLIIISVTIKKIKCIKNGKLSKKWGIFFAFLSPFFLFLAYFSLLLPYSDIPLALRQETEVIVAEVESVHFPGGYNTLVINGVEYRRNPWTFDPEEGTVYRVYYLPNSKYIVDFELLLD